LIPDECISTQGRTALNLHTYTSTKGEEKLLILFRGGYNPVLLPVSNSTH